MQNIRAVLENLNFSCYLSVSFLSVPFLIRLHWIAIDFQKMAAFFPPFFLTLEITLAQDQKSDFATTQNLR